MIVIATPLALAITPVPFTDLHLFLEGRPGSADALHMILDPDVVLSLLQGDASGLVLPIQIPALLPAIDDRLLRGDADGSPERR